MNVIGVIGEKKSQRRGRRPDDTRQVPMFYVDSGPFTAAND